MSSTCTTRESGGLADIAEPGTSKSLTAARSSGTPFPFGEQKGEPGPVSPRRFEMRIAPFCIGKIQRSVISRALTEGRKNSEVIATIRDLDNVSPFRELISLRCNWISLTVCSGTACEENTVGKAEAIDAFDPARRFFCGASLCPRWSGEPREIAPRSMSFEESGSA